MGFAIHVRIRRKYKSIPEYLWRRFPGYAAFRHADNQKWYALNMDMPKDRLGMRGKDRIDILNVKTGDVYFRDILIQQDGYLPGYHFGKGDWISILLDGTVPLEDIYGLIDTSYQVSALKKSRKTADKS